MYRGNSAIHCAQRALIYLARPVKPSDSSSGASLERKSAEALLENIIFLLRHISSLHPRFKNLGFREGGLKERGVI